MMKIKQFAILLIIGLLFVSGCEKTDDNKKSAENVVKETDESGIEYDIDYIMTNQKIVFIMSVSSYSEPYAEGYFIDTEGKKHIYGLYDQQPFESIEKEYAYLMEHYDEFEVVDFFDNTALRKCVDHLYHVDIDSEIRTEGEAIMDAPLKQLYGIRLLDGCEEFVWLGSEPGISERLDDASSDKIFETFGSKWYLLK